MNLCIGVGMFLICDPPLPILFFCFNLVHMSVSKSVPSVIYFLTDFSLRIGVYKYKFQFFVGNLRSLPAKI